MAGILTLMVCNPPSTSRVTVAWSPSISIFDAKVAWDQPSRAASIWPVAFMSLSMACLPAITRPGASASITALRILATASGSTSWWTSSVALTRIARSAPHGERGAKRLLRLLGADRDPRSPPRRRRAPSGGSLPRRRSHRTGSSTSSRWPGPRPTPSAFTRTFTFVVDHPLDGDENLHVRGSSLSVGARVSALGARLTGEKATREGRDPRPLVSGSLPEPKGRRRARRRWRCATRRRTSPTDG